MTVDLTNDGWEEEDTREQEKTSWLSRMRMADEKARFDASIDAPANEIIEDFPKWCAEYKTRLNEAVLPGRNKARNKTLLTVLAKLMEDQRSADILASLRYLSLKANFEVQTVVSGMNELRELGYIKKTKQSSKETTCQLVMAALPESANELPNKGLKSANSGDFSSDAYHSKAMGKNHRLVYNCIAMHPGTTSYAVSKAIKIDPKTAKNAVDWLNKEGLISINEGKAEITSIHSRCEKEKLIDIAITNHTEGKTKRRVERFEKDWKLAKGARIKPKKCLAEEDEFVINTEKATMI